MTTGGKGASGLGVAYVAGGFVLLWSGYANRGIKYTLISFLSGRAPTKAPTGAPTIGVADTGSSAASSAAGSSAAGTTPSAIANDALKYQGHVYVYGGAPGPGGAAGWDCSSFANWVLGHDNGRTLPGASSPGYTGTTHGPNTIGYLGWGAAKTVSNSAATAQAGDLLVWQTHMGFALGNDQMISALNEQLGTRVTSIADGAPGGEILFVRRLTTG